MNEPLPFNTSPLPVRLRLEDYLLLNESGAFDAYAKTELIEGEIFYVNAQHRPHAGVKTRLFVALNDALRDIRSSFVPIVEVSIAMPPDSVPEPDIMVTSEPEGEGLVPLASVALVIEVADTTVSHDMRRKAALYAGVGVPEIGSPTSAGERSRYSGAHRTAAMRSDGRSHSAKRSPLSRSRGWRFPPAPSDRSA